ncbi:MAG TPA: phospho-sugar mutase [Polyangiaceae bacterium]|nr:phospho-sugar mutase [Polyangiaceae bacterium]
MSADSPDLIGAARAWCDADPDPQTAAELRDLIDRGDLAALHSCMGGELEFGTAGLRAAVGPGSLRMNRAVIRRATLAVAQHVKAREPGATLPIVVGADARNSSRGFLEDTVGVLVAQGLRVRYFNEPVPTPLVAFAARQLCARAAIVITASHNPKDDNGYKLYAPNGAQIIPPADSEVAALLAKAPAAKDIPIVADAVSRGHELCEPVGSSVVDRYFECVAVLRPKHGKRRDLRIVYTPMHGVGKASVLRALEGGGFNQVHVVPEQGEPDGNFPTVKFPNPEEPGALDLAMQLADRVDAELILANDPDADRLAACSRAPDGKWRQLSGNQIGIVLADYVLSNVPAKPRPFVGQSIVSTPMLNSVAERYGARCEQTLTGFKWVWNAALEVERRERVRFAFGFEEALGYSIGDLVRDKDGISAAVVLAELVAEDASNGRTLFQRLERLYREHGLWVSVQKSVGLSAAAGMQAVRDSMNRLASNPPKSLAGRAVEGLRDFRQGAEQRPMWLPNTDLIELTLSQGRALARPSGTEPKFKFYVDLKGTLSADANVWQSEQALVQEAKAVAADLATAMGLS